MSEESIPAKVHPVPPIEIYQVFSTELDDIEKNSTGIGTDLQVALVLLPTALTLTVTLSLSSIADMRTFTIFAAVNVVTWCLGLIFAVRWWPKRKGLAGTLKNIRSRRTGITAGQTGKEMTPAQVAALASIEPPSTGDQK
jgi:hypothetical protein